MFIFARFGLTAEFHLVVDLRPDDLPRIAKAQPLIRNLHLPAVPDGLLKDAKLVTDAVADGGHFEGGERIHKTSGQSPQAAVAKPGFFLLFNHVVEIEAKLGESLPGRVNDPEIQEVVGQMWAGQKFRGEIGDYARFLLSASLQGPHALLMDAISNGQCQRCVNIVGRCCHRYPPEAAKEIVDKRLPEIGNAHTGSDAYTGREGTGF